MNSYIILFIIVAYFGILLLIAWITGRKSSSNEAFFLGNRKSPWYIVSIGMVGTSLSGVTFVSVPGMVRSIDMTYMQTVLGFFENASGTLLLDWGGAPVLLRKASADIVLRLTRDWKIETLDLSGRATGTVPVVHDSEGLKFRADTGMRKGGVMAYHLTR